MPQMPRGASREKYPFQSIEQGSLKMFDAKYRLQKKAELRSGIAVTELAVCLPVLVLITLATIESCTMIFVQQSLSIAAYEGARTAILPNATASLVEQQVQQILDDRDVADSTITLSPSSPDQAALGSWIQVQTRAPFTSNSMIGHFLFAGRMLTSSVEMVKEN
jgi:TadE-like protein